MPKDAVRKEPAKLKEEKMSSPSEFMTVNRDTDQVDHRGFPIKEQRRVRIGEPFLNRPSARSKAENLFQPGRYHPGDDGSDSSESSDDFDPGRKTRSSVQDEKDLNGGNAAGGDPDPSELSEEGSDDDCSAESDIRRNGRSPGRRISRRSSARDDKMTLAALQLAFQFLSRNENK